MPYNKTHPIPTAPWQLERSLELILLPLVPEPVKHRVTWSWGGAKGQYIDWMDGETPDSIRLLMALKLQPGDRIYLQEPWCKGDWGTAFDDDIYFTQSTTPEAEHIGWQPAHTMPEAAAEHWYTIADVRVCQCKNISYNDFLDAGMFWNHAEPTFQTSMANQWNTAHPEHPWHSDRWVVALTMEAIAP